MPCRPTCGCWYLWLRLCYFCIVVTTPPFCLPTPLSRLGNNRYNDYHFLCRCSTTRRIVASNPQEEKPKLEEVVPKPKRRTWLENYEKLMQYEAKQGNCNVPHLSKRDTKLANFVRKARYMQSKGALNKDHKKKLDDLEFEWVFMRRSRKRITKNDAIQSKAWKFVTQGVWSYLGENWWFKSKIAIDLMISQSVRFSVPGSSTRYIALVFVCLNFLTWIAFKTWFKHLYLKM